MYCCILLSPMAITLSIIFRNRAKVNITLDQQVMVGLQTFTMWPWSAMNRVTVPQNYYTALKLKKFSRPGNFLLHKHAFLQFVKTMHFAFSTEFSSSVFSSPDIREITLNNIQQEIQIWLNLITYSINIITARDNTKINTHINTNTGEFVYYSNLHW